MSAWRHPYQFTLVNAAEENLSIMSSFEQDRPEKLEAGGILLGRRRGNHIEIISVTEPGPRDIRQRTFFHRRDPSHQESAIRLWQESNGEIDYVGEWHTHPELHPTLSGLDCEQCRKASLAYGKPLVIIIVGIKTFFCAWMVNGAITKINPV